MNPFLNRAPIPPWKFLLYGLLAAAGVALLGIYFSERGLVIAAGFAGLAIAGFGIFIQWSQGNPWMRARARLFLMIGIIGNVLLLVWRILDHK